MHSPPERDPNPPDQVEDLECSECDQPMEYKGGDDWKCEYPFCDSNKLDPKVAYENLGDHLYTARKEKNGLIRLMRSFLKCVEREQIHGSATFNDMISIMRIVTDKIPIDHDWSKYYLAEIRAEVEKLLIEAEGLSALSGGNRDRMAERVAYQRTLDLIDGKKPEK